MTYALAFCYLVGSLAGDCVFSAPVTDRTSCQAAATEANVNIRASNGHLDEARFVCLEREPSWRVSQ